MADPQCLFRLELKYQEFFSFISKNRLLKTGPRWLFWQLWTIIHCQFYFFDWQQWATIEVAVGIHYFLLITKELPSAVQCIYSICYFWWANIDLIWVC